MKTKPDKQPGTQLLEAAANCDPDDVDATKLPAWLVLACWSVVQERLDQYDRERLY